jgi:hypothetical protein
VAATTGGGPSPETYLREDGSRHMDAATALLLAFGVGAGIKLVVGIWAFRRGPGGRR